MLLPESKSSETTFLPLRISSFRRVLRQLFSKTCATIDEFLLRRNQGAAGER